jgi:hypothetical protein
MPGSVWEPGLGISWDGWRRRLLPRRIPREFHDCRCLAEAPLLSLSERLSSPTSISVWLQLTLRVSGNAIKAQGLRFGMQFDSCRPLRIPSRHSLISIMTRIVVSPRLPIPVHTSCSAPTRIVRVVDHAVDHGARDANCLDAQTLIHVEALLAVQTLHKFSRSLANRSSDAAGIDFYRPALGANITVFVFQCDVVRVQCDLP